MATTSEHRLCAYLIVFDRWVPLCVCGWSGPRYATRRAATLSYRAHVAGKAARVKREARS